MSLQNSSTKLIHEKQFSNFKLSIDSHYDFFKDNPNYGLYINISNIN